MQIIPQFIRAITHLVHCDGDVHSVHTFDHDHFCTTCLSYGKKKHQSVDDDDDDDILMISCPHMMIPHIVCSHILSESTYNLY